MKVAFADSSIYVALLIARDANHIKAKAVAQSSTDSVVTTEYVLAEVANHLSGSLHHRVKYGQLLAGLEADPNAVIVAKIRNVSTSIATGHNIGQTPS